MPDPFTELAVEPGPGGGTAQPAGLAELAAAVAAGVLAIPGVVRLEPTLSGQLRQWSAEPVTAIRSGLAELPDGVVVRERNGVVEARIDVAVRPVRAAVETAAEVRRATAQMITSVGRRPGTIMVSVLAVEPD